MLEKKMEQITEAVMEQVKEEISMYNPSPQEFAAIYARRSTPIENNSLASQAALAKEIIRKNKLFVYDIYEDVQSATKFHPTHRPGFKRLLYDAMQGKFKTVVVFRRDRLARKADDLIEIRNLFKKYGIKIIYSNDKEFQANDSYISNFIENIIMSVDELEPNILKKRIIAGQEQKRLRGEYAGKPPFGYIKKSKLNEAQLRELTPEDEKIELFPDPKKSELVNNIFNSFIKTVFNAEDWGSFIKDINAKQNLKKFNKDSLEEILLRPIYGKLLIKNSAISILDTLDEDSTGQYFIRSEYFTTCTNVKQIVDRALWESCLIRWRTITPERRRIQNEEENYLFKGLLFFKTNKEKPIYLSEGYYHCIEGFFNVPEDDLQDILLTKIIQDILTTDNLAAFHMQIKLDIERAIRKNEVELDKLKAEQQQQVLKLITNFTAESETNYTDLNILINKQKNIEEKIGLEKESASKTSIAIEEIKNMSNINHLGILINMLKRNVDTSQVLLTTLIHKIYFRKSKGGQIDDRYTFEFEYKK